MFWESPDPSQPRQPRLAFTNISTRTLPWSIQQGMARMTRKNLGEIFGGWDFLDGDFLYGGWGVSPTGWEQLRLQQQSRQGFQWIKDVSGCIWIIYKYFKAMLDSVFRYIQPPLLLLIREGQRFGRHFPNQRWGLWNFWNMAPPEIDNTLQKKC